MTKQFKPGQTTWYVVGLVVLVITICLAVPLSIRAKENSSASSKRFLTQENVAAEVDLLLRTGYQTAFGAVLSLEGYVTGSMAFLPDNTNVNASQRIQGQTFASFLDYAKRLEPYVFGMKSMQLQPSGVINQVYPLNSGTIGLDLLYRNTTLSPSLYSDILDGHLVFLDGPRPFVQGGFGFVLRKLVYLANSTSPSLDTWWGTVALLINWDEYVSTSGVSALLIKNSALHAMYTTATVAVYYTNFNTSQHNIADVLAGSCREVRLPQNKSWTSCLLLPQTSDYFTQDQLFAVIFGGIFIPLLLGVCALIALWQANQEYDGREHAPKVSPMVYTLIGIHKAEKLWDKKPEEMERIRSRFAEIVRTACHQCRAYEVEELLGCYTIATRSIDAAIHLGFLVGEELQRNPILLYNSPASNSNQSPTDADSSGYGGGRLQRRGSATTLHGKDHGSKNLKFMCFINLCQEVEIQYDLQTQRYTYDGPDILYSHRIFSVCWPGMITLAQGTAQYARGVKDVELVNLPPVAMRGQGFAVLSAVIDKKNPEMWEKTITEHQLGIGQHKDRSESLQYGNDGLTRKQDTSKIHTMSTITHDLLPTEDDKMDVFNMMLGPSIPGPSSNYQLEQGNLLQTALPTAVPLAEGYWGNMANVARQVPEDAQHAIKRIFDYQALVIPNMDFDGMKGLFFAFYLAFRVLFHPFADVEQKNIFRRLVTLFGVPQAGEILENLAVRCAMIAMTRDEYVGNELESRSLNASVSNRDSEVESRGGHHSGVSDVEA